MKMFRRGVNRRAMIGVTAVLVLAVIVAGCGASLQGSANTQSIAGSSATPMMMPTQIADRSASPSIAPGAELGFAGEATAADGLFDVDGEVAQQQEGQSQQPRERIILRNASMVIIVEDTEATIDMIGTMADEMGGWVVNANTNTRDYANDVTITNGNITVRVPAEQLDNALQSIRDGALEISSESVNGQDVTEDYVDLSSRLRNLEASEAQFLLILEDARRVDDVLAVQRELTTVREQIEVIQGRLRFYDEAAAFSSIAVTVNERVPSVGNVEVAGWNPLDTAANAFGTLLVTGQWLVDAVIVVAIVGLPLLIGVGVAVWIVRRVWRAVFGGRKTAAATGD